MKKYSAILTVFLALTSTTAFGFNEDNFEDCTSQKEIAEKLIYKQSIRPETRSIEPYSRSRKRDCYAECEHLLRSPSGDLQSSEYRKCYRECKGSL